MAALKDCDNAEACAFVLGISGVEKIHLETLAKGLRMHSFTGEMLTYVREPDVLQRRFRIDATAALKISTAISDRVSDDSRLAADQRISEKAVRKEPEEVKFPFRTAQPLALFERAYELFTPSTVNVVHHVDGGLGSTGVNLVHTDEGCFVIKSGKMAFQEIFCERLYRLLDITVPRIQLLASEKRDRIQTVLRRVPCTNDMTRYQHFAKYANLLIMEYIPGATILELTAAKRLELSESALVSLGRVIAADVIVNNFDRVPFVWSNSGNLGNVIVERDTQAVVAVDQQTTAIVNVEGSARYLDAVRDAVAQVRDQALDGSALRRVVDTLERTCGRELTRAQCQALLEGLTQGLRTVRRVCSRDALQSLFESVVVEFCEAGAQFRFEAVSVDFIMSIVDVCDMEGGSE